MVLEEVMATRKLRDSVSTVLSGRTEASLTGSAIDTPNSSPASSVIMSRKSSDYGHVTPVGKKSRQPSASSVKSSVSANRRLSGLPLAAGRKSISSSRLEALATPAHPPRSITPTRQRSTTPSLEKPRWNISTNMRDTIVGHHYIPLHVTEASPHRKSPTTPLKTLRSVSSHSAIPVRSPLSQNSALSPLAPLRPTSTLAHRPLASPMQSPTTPARGKSALARSTTPSSSQSHRTPTSGRKVTIAEEESDGTVTEESPVVRRATRPASALNSRRTSMLPTPKPRTPSGTSIPQIMTPSGRTHSRMGSTEDGRRSKLGLDAGRKSQLGMTSGRKSSLEERPRWR